jgi:hypothetical protein
MHLQKFRETTNDMKEKMFKILKMCEGTDFKVNDAMNIIEEGLINLIEIKQLNAEVQKVKFIF